MESTADASNISHIGPDSCSNLPTATQPKLGDTTFQYQPLDSTKTQIRILHIKPGQYEHDMECSISHVLLKRRKSSKFKAISYAWGDPEDTLLIRLDGHQFPVTRSLWGALRALRSEHDEIFVWADAVSINQSDLIERGLQVQNMTEIYATASETTLWLGFQQDDSDLGMDLINDLGSNLYPHKRSLAVIFDAKHRRGLEALIHLFQRSYWDRLWCVQELWNSRAIAVYCGRHKTSLLLCQIFQGLVVFYPTVFKQHLSIRSSTRPSWYAILGYGGPATMMGAECRKDRVSLRDALQTNRQKLCMDPRDRLYAILSLLDSEKYFPVLVDYSASICDVFTGIVMYDVKCTSKLDIICGSTPRSEKRFSLPSWVPDWTAREDLGPLGLGSKFRASGDSIAIATFTDSRSKLRVSAIKIDDIEDVLDKIPETGDKSVIFLALRTWRSQVSQKLGTDSSFYEALLTTFAVNKRDLKWTSDWLKHNCYSGFQDLECNQPHDLYNGRIPDGIDDSYMYKRWPKRITYYLPKRQYSLTAANSMFCMSVGDVRQGDQIFVLLGCSSPVILRQLEGGVYQYIGEICVHGYMYGGAMEEKDTGLRKVETVTLV